MNGLVAILGAIAVVLASSQAEAEVVWTCTQPAVVDGEPNGEPIETRYYVSGDKLYDPSFFDLQWNIVENNSAIFVATVQEVSSLPDARTLVIDPKTGDMVLAVINIHSTDPGSLLIKGSCVKD